MLIPGLVTITFRKFGREKICAVAKKAGLSLLEWGGDIHVPPLDGDAIADAVRLTKEAGLGIDTYGSYYRCGVGEDAGAVVRTAASLGAKNLRVWAGPKGSAEASADERAAVIRDLRAVCDLAALHGMTVSTECHNWTLTDDYESAMRMANETERGNFRLYWQPNQFRDDAYNRRALRASLPYLSNVHVFSWSGQEHYPLDAHEKLWREYIEIISSDSSASHGMFLEFTWDDSEEQLYRDAEVLLGWLS